MKEDMDTSKQESVANESDDKGVFQDITPAFMDRKSAMAYFGLNETANAYELDQKYWQYIKKYRVDPKKYHDKLEEISQVYFIASGKKNEEKLKEISRSKEKKLFGKTFADWKVHFYYSWWKYVAAVVIAVIAFFLIRQIFFLPRSDFRIVSLGHFEKTENALAEYMKSNLGYADPEIANVDIIIDNSETGSMETMYSSLSAAALLSVDSDVIITDITTMSYFLNYLSPMDDFYASLCDTLSEEQLSVIIPVYYSYAEFYDLPADEENPAEPPIITEKDYERHIYGLMILDPEAIDSLGYISQWRLRIPSMVFSVSITAGSEAESQAVIRSILADEALFSGKK